MAELDIHLMAERRILIGSLSAPNFRVRTGKMDSSRSDFTDLCSWKDIQKENLASSSSPPKKWYNIDKSGMKNGEKAQGNHEAYAAWALILS